MAGSSPELSLGALVAERLDRLRRQQPLIHHLTNFVVMATTADATRAIGALPVMTYAEEEAAEMTESADALVLNLGTPTQPQYAACLHAGRAANVKGIPIIVDPVGVGATRYRLENAGSLVDAVRPTIVRGNAAEIAALVGVAAEIRGVESVSTGIPAAEILRLAVRHTGGVVAITGAIDVVSDGARLARVSNGAPLLGAIVGSGCTATTLIAAFAAVEPDALLATVCGLVCIGVAGEIAAERSSGPGSGRVALLDALSVLDRPTLEGRCRAEISDLDGKA